MCNAMLEYVATPCSKLLALAAARCLHLAGAHHVAGYACLPSRQRGNNSHAHPLRQVRCGGVWVAVGLLDLYFGGLASPTVSKELMKKDERIAQRPCGLAG